MKTALNDLKSLLDNWTDEQINSGNDSLENKLNGLEKKATTPPDFPKDIQIITWGMTPLDIDPINLNNSYSLKQWESFVIKNWTFPSWIVTMIDWVISWHIDDNGQGCIVTIKIVNQYGIESVGSITVWFQLA
jgi:hypothetical protein